MKELRISAALGLPLDVAGEAIAILAKRGAGKTNTATVLVEEIHAAGIQVVILDPVGSWWGIRSSADGKGEGLPIARLGGEHGDVPLEPTAGALIADVAVDSGQSLLVDLSDFPSKGATNRFVTDFAERLYRRKARDKQLLHLVLEEADEFAPQSKSADTARMRGAIEQIVRRGRGRGLGLTMITQRSAVLNKDVLEQADVLIAMRTTGPNDRKAILSWVEGPKGDEGGAEIVDSLPGLDTGEAWIWNPEREIRSRVQIRRRRTFDSSSTPKAGERRAEPKSAAAIDLGKLGAEIQATADRVKENDPAELRKRLRLAESHNAALAARLEGLEREVRTATELDPVRVEVSAIAAVELEPALQRLDETRESFELAFTSLRYAEEELADLAKRVAAFPEASATSGERAHPGGDRRHGPLPSSSSPTAPHRPPARQTPAPQEGDLHLKPSEAAQLAVLAQFPAGRTRKQLAVLAGYSAKSSTFRNALGRLRTLGLATPASVEPIQATEAGMEAAAHVEPLPTGRALFEHWRGQLKPSERALLDTLYAAWPAGLDRDALAEAAEYSAASSTFRNALGRLRTLELATPAGIEPIRLSDELFEEPA